MALVLSRGKDQGVRLMLDPNITAAELADLIQKGISIKVLECNAEWNQAKLSIVAPKSVSIMRNELLTRAALNDQVNTSG